MGGLGPGIGGLEILVIGLVALLVVGPKDLPLLMRKVGQVMAKARGMANEFRASFDEMARQSELDELRKEVDALRRGQGIHPLGEEANAAFRDINRDLNAPLTSPPAQALLSGPDEWPDAPVMTPIAPVEPAVETVTETKPKPRARKATAAKTATRAKSSTAKSPAKPRKPRAKQWPDA
ncbi:Sec-independent protein translocase protein TatB [Brevundimonas sp.]|uniref:Sec-independent protein translocase protein TatB n=1 Tax=Brevundimonas sp. TaxID=1871086 RepID=UPI002ABA69FD|nr:Sec-independent protein translocase protein TatB [Brevundimonas sp.]MDZ4363341.1 Sec-independent protein translocase protein TatB [Brevundimonas sp.]